MATLLGEGLAPERALDGIAERFRLLLSAGVCGADPEILGTGPEEAALLVEEASGFEPEQLVHMIALCDAANARVRVSASPRAILDAAVARMAMSERFARAASLLAGDAAAATPSKKKRLTAAEPRPASKPSAPAVSEATSAPDRVVKSPSRSEGREHPRESPRPEHSERSRPAEPPRRTTPPETPPTTAPATPPDVEAGSAGPWARLEAAATTPRHRAMLADFEFDRLEGDRLRLRRREDASPGVDWTVSHPDSLERLASEALGRRIRVEFIGATSSDATPSPIVVDDVESHPLVAEAMELFDAHVVQVRTIEGSPKVEEPDAKPDKED